MYEQQLFTTLQLKRGVKTIAALAGVLLLCAAVALLLFPRITCNQRGLFYWTKGCCALNVKPAFKTCAFFACQYSTSVAVKALASYEFVSCETFTCKQVAVMVGDIFRLSLILFQIGFWANVAFEYVCRHTEISSEVCKVSVYSCCIYSIKKKSKR